jgi:Nuclease-related domain
LDHVREHLPDPEPYRAWTNLEIITNQGRSLEVDLLVIGPAGLYLVELKSYEGRIGGDRYHWRRTIGRRSWGIESPWRLANEKSRILKSVLELALRKWGTELGVRVPARDALPFVQAAILLHHPSTVVDLAPEERTFVYGLEGSEVSSNLDGIVSGLLARRPPNPNMQIGAAAVLRLPTRWSA